MFGRYRCTANWLAGSSSPRRRSVAVVSTCSAATSKKVPGGEAIASDRSVSVPSASAPSTALCSRKSAGMTPSISGHTARYPLPSGRDRRQMHRPAEHLGEAFVDPGILTPRLVAVGKRDRYGGERFSGRRRCEVPGLALQERTPQPGMLRAADLARRRVDHRIRRGHR